MDDCKAGVTLVELTVAISVVGILLALTVPSLARVRDRAETRVALNQFSADVAYARILAMRAGGRVEVAFMDGAACGDRRFGRFTADGYRVAISGPFSQTIVERRLSVVGRAGVCLDSNNDRTIVFNSRGLLVPFENRTVWARRGDTADSLAVSVLGRVRRLRWAEPPRSR